MSVTKILQNEELRKDIFWMAVITVVACCSVYVYCITATVRNIVEKKNVLTDASDMSEKISAKEFQLISMQNTITPTYAEAQGFSDPTVKTFVSPQNVSFVYEY